MCDPSSPDVTGRVVEALGILKDNASFRKCFQHDQISKRMNVSALRAIEYLACEQTAEGGWYGRWACNYVYGTSDVLCGLEHWMSSSTARTMVESGIGWLKSVQNADGGFGESFDTYHNPKLAGQGKSTATQTAWAVMGLLAHLTPMDPTIEKAVAWLVSNFSREESGGTWQETTYASVGFPRFFYIQYSLYPHYFPMMALGRYYQATQRNIGLNPISGLETS